MTIEAIIERKLLSAFSPVHLDIINESHQHKYNASNESHFKVIIVSSDFEGERIVKRHRAINTLLTEELTEKIQALALHTYTEREWRDYYIEDFSFFETAMGRM